MKKVGKILGCFSPFVVALLCQLLVSFGAAFFIGIVLTVMMTAMGITDAAEMETYIMDFMSNGTVLLLITAVATLVTLLVGALWYRGHKPETDLKLKEVVNPKLLVAMAIMGLSLQFLVSMCLNAVYPILPQTLTEQYNELMESLLGGNVWLSLIVTVILAPLAEELLFRGITLKKAQKIMPFMAANVLQAVLFGVYHMNLIQGVYAFALGMILGFTAEYFHSIWAAILLHAFVNGSAELLSHLPESITSTYIGVICIAVVSVVLLFVAAKLYPQARTIRTAEENQKFSENSFDEL